MNFDEAIEQALIQLRVTKAERVQAEKDLHDVVETASKAIEQATCGKEGP